MPAAVATVASIIGVFVAIDQLTSGSRLRRQASFWAEQIGAADLVQDRAVAQSLYRETTSRLIALQAYPGRRLSGWVTLAFFSIYSVGATAFLTGTMATDDFTYRKLREQGVDPLFLLISWSTLQLALYKVANVFVQRRLMARHYLEGGSLTTKAQFNENELDTTEGIKQSAWDIFRVMMGTAGACLLIAATSFAAGLPRADSPDATTLPEWLFFVVMAGLLLFFLGLFPVMDMFNQERSGWEHPRKPLPVAETPHPAERLTLMKRLRDRFSATT